MERSQSVCPDGQCQPSEQASQDKERYLLLSVGCLSLEYTNRFVSSTHKSSRNLGHHSAYCVAVRTQLQRCAEVVWHYVTHTLGMTVSLSRVRRILRRHHCFDGARKPRIRRSNPHRPRATAPGKLVQIDTIHHVDPHTGKRLYYYTVIDLFSRLAYAESHTSLRPGIAAAVVLRAQEKWRSYGFTTISLVQCDNGPEFGRYFAQELKRAGIQLRHSRLGRPNDNAHIERFNRTLQEECIGHVWRRHISLGCQRQTLACYIDFYNSKRIHVGIQLRTPAGMLQRW